MKIGEPTLEELFREAQADLAKGGTDVALKWAFRHARARARVTRAELADQSHRSDRLTLSMELHDRQALDSRLAALQALESNAASLYADAVDLADARAAETACEHVWQLAVRQPKAAAAPAAAPKRAA
jgi:hypothetical protein